MSLKPQYLNTGESQNPPLPPPCLGMGVSWDMDRVSCRSGQTHHVASTCECWENRCASPCLVSEVLRD